MVGLPALAVGLRSPITSNRISWKPRARAIVRVRITIPAGSPITSNRISWKLPSFVRNESFNLIKFSDYFKSD